MRTFGMKLYIGDEIWKRHKYVPSDLCNGVTIEQPDSEGSFRLWFRKIKGNKFKLGFVQVKYKNKKTNEFINNIGGI